MRRISVLGCSGSGKSTLARAIGATLDLPVCHMDRHYFAPGWVEPDMQTWENRVKALCADQNWVMDGNYSRTLHLRAPRSTEFVFLDVPTSQCLWRVLKRFWTNKGRSRIDVAPGCPEKIDAKFLGYVLNYNRQRAPKIKKLLVETGKPVRILSCKDDIYAYLEELSLGVNQ